MIRSVEGLSLAGSSQARGGNGARGWEPRAAWGSRTFEASDKVKANRADGICLQHQRSFAHRKGTPGKRLPRRGWFPGYEMHGEDRF